MSLEVMWQHTGRMANKSCKEKLQSWFQQSLQFRGHRLYGGGRNQIVTELQGPSRIVIVGSGLSGALYMTLMMTEVCVLGYVGAV